MLCCVHNGAFNWEEVVKGIWQEGPLFTIPINRVIFLRNVVIVLQGQENVNAS